MIDGRTRILGIFGDPVAHSLSPLMQNAALEALGIDAVYLPFHVDAGGLSAAVAGIRALDLLGVNVTVPHKEAVCALLDELDSEARLIGAVNTIVNRQGRLVGFNTDGRGFLQSLARDLEFTPRGKRIVLLGAGGACRAALVALARSGAASLTLLNRTPQKAEALCREFQGLFPGTTFAHLPLGSAETNAAFREEGVDLIVNTSSVGLKGETFPGLSWDDIPSRVAFYDMVYGQLTPFLQAARAGGHRFADGLGMLAAQGEEAFMIWTGRQPPEGLMEARLRDRAPNH